MIVNMQISGTQEASASSSQLLCWVESLILALGIPSAIWAVSKLISFSIPSAVHGSSEQRFLLWIMGGVIVEWLIVIVLWFVLRNRGYTFKDLGVWSFGRWSAWAIALLFAALSIASNLRFLPQNARPHLICILADWIPSLCSASHGNYRRLLRGSPVSSFSYDRIRQSGAQQSNAGHHSGLLRSDCPMPAT